MVYFMSYGLVLSFYGTYHLYNGLRPYYSFLKFQTCHGAHFIFRITEFLDNFLGEYKSVIVNWLYFLLFLLLNFDTACDFYTSATATNEVNEQQLQMKLTVMLWLFFKHFIIFFAFHLNTTLLSTFFFFSDLPLLRYNTYKSTKWTTHSHFFRLWTDEDHINKSHNPPKKKETKKRTSNVLNPKMKA